MTRVSFREVADRFSHIDGEIVSAEASSRPHERSSVARVVLSFYPWWEHPMYIEARNSGRDWGFDVGSEGCREVTVDAVNPLRCELRFDSSATDVAFLTKHPALWEFEDAAQIYCNSDFDPLELIQAILKRHVPYVTAGTLAEYLVPFAQYHAPYSLGDVPFTLFHLVREELERMGVALSIPREPAAPPNLVAFAVDDNVLIVAEDFLLDVPEFEHRPEWFRPQSEE